MVVLLCPSVAVHSTDLTVIPCTGVDSERDATSCQPEQKSCQLW